MTSAQFPAETLRRAESIASGRLRVPLLRVARRTVDVDHQTKLTSPIDYNYRHKTMAYYRGGEGSAELPGVALWDGGKCVQCECLEMTHTNSV